MDHFKFQRQRHKDIYSELLQLSGQLQEFLIAIRIYSSGEADSEFDPDLCVKYYESLKSTLIDLLEQFVADDALLKSVVDQGIFDIELAELLAKNQIQ